MRKVLFILPNGARRWCPDVRSKQPYNVGALVKTSLGELLVIDSNSGDPDAIARDGHETVKLRYPPPPQSESTLRICVAGSNTPIPA